MKLARSTKPEPSLASDLARAIVKDVTPEGLVVATDESGAEVACEVLVIGGLAATLEAGDLVLVWRPAADARGVVLGRIGRLDGETAADAPAELVLQARRRLTVRCAESAVELRGDGKVVVKGRDVVSRASRTNRIKGGSVGIN